MSSLSLWRLRPNRKIPRADGSSVGLRNHKLLPVHPWSEQHGSPSRSGCAQIFSGRFAGPAVGDDVKADFLPLIEGAHAGAFNRADMNEDVIAAVVELNEAEALLAVKPLHSSCIHGECPLMIAYTQDLGAEGSAPSSV